MSAANNQYKDRNFIAVIGDEDTVTGLLLAGVGHIDSRQKSNFLVVDAKWKTRDEADMNSYMLIA
ncbi:H(+)-transporting V1 sector ATPase subunit F [Basidiobolus ranarum]|uniref:H(+)-transporting V1 sector ATPase subunit F n=1 Tax=Basidiobolus ranarum TaxID=34480 RepID=A0ABR2WT96_9FUNG